MGKVIDMTGNLYGRLTVVEFAGFANDRQATWRCKCECGNESVVPGGCLRSGHSTSCGCYGLEVLKTASITHGMSKTTTFAVWRGMLQRCRNPKNPAYSKYGGRGITVCDQWLSFERFLSDMGVRPDGKSLDRINNNEGYSPSNCRWASRKTQNSNKTTTVLLTIDGVTQCARDWSRSIGVNQSLITNRVKAGMTHKEAYLATLNAKRSRMREHNEGKSS